MRTKTKKKNGGRYWDKLPIINPLSLMILGISVLSIVIPIVLAITVEKCHSVYGLPVCAAFVLLGIAALTYKGALKDHPAETYTGGIYVFFGAFTDVTIGPGKAFIAPWMGINTINVELARKDLDIDVDGIVTSDGAPLEGTVSISMDPNSRDLIDYISAGKMVGVEAQIDDVVKAAARIACRKRTIEEVQTKILEVAEEIKGLIHAQGLGIKIGKCNIDLSVPQAVLDAATEGRVQVKKAEAAKVMNTALMAMAVDRLNAYKSSAGPGVRVPSLQQCLQEIRDERLILDGKVLRVEGASGVLLRADLSELTRGSGGPQNRRNKNKGRGNNNRPQPQPQP